MFLMAILFSVSVWMNLPISPSYAVRMHSQNNAMKSNNRFKIYYLKKRFLLQIVTSYNVPFFDNVYAAVIWNDILELQRQFWKQSVQSDTLWNVSYYCRDNFENNGSKACILTVFKTLWNCRDHCINNSFKACALKVFETIWNCREKMKTMYI